MRWNRPSLWLSKSSVRQGLLDPEVEVRPTMGQMDDLLGEINARTEKRRACLYATLTKKMAEDLDLASLKEMGVGSNTCL